MAEYVRERAVAYARRWALARNPLFYNFTGIGGDCTNFVSQCVLAGCCVMNGTRDFGWYYRSVEDRAPAWTGVGYFYDFLTGAPAFAAENGGVGPYARVVERGEAETGDVVQLGDREGDFYHTLILTKTAGRLLVCAHSNDALDRPLDSYDYTAARFLHIEGVREAPAPSDCFRDLMEGVALPD